MDTVSRRKHVLVPLLTAGLIVAVGCASTASTTTGKGPRLYKKGQNVYVCRDGHTAPTLDQLVDRLRQGGSPENPPTGQAVIIEQRDSVQVDGSSVYVARVEPSDGGTGYWIPYTALCSRG